MTDKMSCRESMTNENHAVSDDHLCTNIKTAYCITRTRTREKILDKKCGYLWVQKCTECWQGPVWLWRAVVRGLFWRTVVCKSTNDSLAWRCFGGFVSLFAFPFSDFR